MQASIAGEAELPAQAPAVAGVMSKALRLVAIGAIAVGLIIRSVPLLSKPEAPLNTCDGRAYYEMAVSLAQGNGLVINDPFLLQACEGHLTLGPSHHFAPGLPIIEALFVGVFGDGRIALVVPLILLSWLAVAFALWTTNDLYGTDAALLVGAAVSLDWTGSFYGTFLGYSENLVLIVITVTLWAILRAIRSDRFVLFAGLAAGIGYLSKASIGWFFIIAGIGGFVYRLMFRGWGVLRNGWYWAAIGIFALPVALWSYRNFSLFWDGTPGGLIDAWQTSGIISGLVATALRSPGSAAGRPRRQAASDGRPAARSVPAVRRQLLAPAEELAQRGGLRAVAGDRADLRARLVLRVPSSG